MSEYYLIVLWEKARVEESRILEDVRRHVSVVASFEQRWPRDSDECFKRFYGVKAKLAAGKSKHCGGGRFLTLVVRDDRPRYGWRRTSRGSEFVNLRLFAMKSRYRKWTGGGHKVHSTNTEEETRRDIYLLTGSTLEEWKLKPQPVLDAALPGACGWMSVAEIFRALGETIEYASLRQYSEKRFELLVSNIPECACTIGGRSRKIADGTVVNTVKVGEQEAVFEIVGICSGRYDPLWAREVLSHGCGQRPDEAELKERRLSCRADTMCHMMAARCLDSFPLSKLTVLPDDESKGAAGLPCVRFFGRTEDGRDCLIDCLGLGHQAILTDWDCARKVYSIAPEHVFKPLFFRQDAIGSDYGISIRQYSGEVPLRNLYGSGVSADFIRTLAGETVHLMKTLSSLGICHRNLNLDNLYWGEDGHLKVLNFYFAVQTGGRSKEAPWLSVAWRRLLDLGVRSRRSPGVWNDSRALTDCLMTLGGDVLDRNVRGELAAIGKGCDYVVRFSSRYFFGLFVRWCCLFVFGRFCRRGAEEFELLTVALWKGSRRV